ncbi:MAG: NIPSNAP family protein, partial [Cytophagales bacterium]|nr:NIPSNAP family protein [Cytophagales bacterium]
MKRFLFLAVLLCTVVAFVSKKSHGRLYEMRVYYAEPGKLNDLLTRFRNHSTKLLEKHGMTNEGYWLPIDNKDNKLIYVMSYPDRAARDKSWKDFFADPEWQKVSAESEKNGKLVAKVDEIFMQATDFSPKKIAKKGAAGRVFELRTYKATAGNLDNLLARFRNHTVKLFEKHGMTNLWYWTYAPG